MNCDELTRTIPLYLYSELSFDEEEQVELPFDDGAEAVEEEQEPLSAMRKEAADE